MAGPASAQVLEQAGSEPGQSALTSGSGGAARSSDVQRGYLLHYGEEELDAEGSVPPYEGQTPAPPYYRRSPELRPIDEIAPSVTEPEPGEFPDQVTLPSEEFAERDWIPAMFAWEASNVAHLPLYYEDVALERNGHTLGCVLQPLRSTQLFLQQTVLLPYQIAVEPMCEPVYSLGYIRPGDPAPKLCYRPVCSCKGALFETTAWAGAFLIIP